jgi:DNA-binding transcriptional LysR family regulator
LRIFDEVYRTRSVSRAAQDIGVTQPTISVGLGKLRKYFNDPLFVRTSHGMEPTPHADQLVKWVRQALDSLQMAVGHQVVFDPPTSERTFRIGFTDISQIVLAPKLMTHLKSVAPNVRIEISHITEGIAQALESGDVDLSAGFTPQLQAGFYQQKLFKQDYVCLAGKEHPRIGTKLTLKQFVEESHLVVTTTGTGHWIVEKTLEDLKIRRRIALRVPSFLGVGIIVANTDLLVTVPRRLGEAFAREASVKVLSPPMKLPAYLVKQHWHERYHHDGGNKWLRNVMAELFGE